MRNLVRLAGIVVLVCLLLGVGFLLPKLVRQNVVRVFHQTSTSPQRALDFLKIKDGDLLKGEVEVLVTRPDDRYQYEDIQFYVDGAYAGTGGDPHGLTSPHTLIPFSTCPYSNGPHTLMIVDKRGTKVTRKVKIRNAFSSVRIDDLFNTTNSDGLGAPRTCHITGRVDSPKPWRILIQTLMGKPQTLRSYDIPSHSIDIHWDGKDSQGREVEDGPYVIVFQSRGSSLYSDIINKLGSRK